MNDRVENAPNGESAELLAILRCVECGGELASRGEEAVCRDCGARIHSFRGRPVLLSRNNLLFPPDEYRDSRDSPSGREPVSQRRSFRRRIKNLVPSKSVNLSRRRTIEAIAAQLKPGARLLVVGGGRQRTFLANQFGEKEPELIVTDIDQWSDCDVFCDAHHLPFSDEFFDGVITTAVLEHVLEPWTVASEISRLVKEGGFVYSEVPFLQGVHEGAYDFTRFTLGGHRALFRNFKEIEAGAVAGPGTTFVWSASGLAESVFPGKRTAQMMSMVARICFGWVKFLDKWVAKRPVGEDQASCTYFWGVKADRSASEADIVARYRGRQHLHIVAPKERR